MDSFEITKFAAAVLSALLLMVGAKTYLDLPGHGAGHGNEHGYNLPAPKTAAAATAAAPAAAAAFTPAAVVGLLASAKADNGAAVFKKCTACHSIDKAGANKVGPALYGVVGRAKASVAGFGYSDVLKSKGGNWSYEDLASFLNSPGTYAKGTKMSFAGIAETSDLADLIAYLRAQADSPAALPAK